MMGFVFAVLGALIAVGAHVNGVTNDVALACLVVIALCTARAADLLRRRP